MTIADAPCKQGFILTSQVFVTNFYLFTVKTRVTIATCTISTVYYRKQCRVQMIRSNTLFNFVCYHPDEHQILTTGTDRKIGYWEAFDGSMIRELDGSSGGSINTMDISADGKYFVSGGDDRLIKVRARLHQAPASNAESTLP